MSFDHASHIKYGNVYSNAAFAVLPLHHFSEENVVGGMEEVRHLVAQVLYKSSKCKPKPSAAITPTSTVAAEADQDLPSAVACSDDEGEATTAAAVVVVEKKIKPDLGTIDIIEPDAAGDVL